jgi:hypothetical protein
MPVATSQSLSSTMRASTPLRRHALDRVGRAQVIPVIGREVVERQQGLSVFREAGDGFLVFGPVFLGEGVNGGRCPALTACLRNEAPQAIRASNQPLPDVLQEFTDRLFSLRRRPATGAHDFDLLCAELGIDHRLAPPMRPQTNGMVERFNGRIEDVLQSHRFRSGEHLKQTILRYVQLQRTAPATALKGMTPIGALKGWHRQKPELFKKRPCNHPGWDS